MRIRWPSDPSAHRILKSKNGIDLSFKSLTEQSLVQQQQYEVHTEERVAIDALDYEYNEDARTPSPRLCAARLQLAVGRHGLGPRDQEEQRTQGASLVATYHTRVHSSSSSRSSCLARMLGFKKNHVMRLGTCLRGQTKLISAGLNA